MVVEVANGAGFSRSPAFTEVVHVLLSDPVPVTFRLQQTDAVIYHRLSFRSLYVTGRGDKAV